MGEGWSDAIGIFLTRSATDTRNTDVPVGWYIVGSSPSGGGIRQYQYSTKLFVNPHMNSDLESISEIHQIGEVWATMLYEMYWNLVDKYGFSPNWLENKRPEGNIVAMQILIGGLMRQPCNPTFIQARDAIIQADIDYYGGVNKCLIWKAFAKRGLGVNANAAFDNGFKFPSGC
jgi:Fungalysin metallopeptidase (M36)